jgi:hypothetical protein
MRFLRRDTPRRSPPLVRGADAPSQRLRRLLLLALRLAGIPGPAIP